jgi:hypothetical protein
MVLLAENLPFVCMVGQNHIYKVYTCIHSIFAEGVIRGPKQGYLRNVTRVWAPKLAVFKLSTQR